MSNQVYLEMENYKIYPVCRVGHPQNIEEGACRDRSLARDAIARSGKRRRCNDDTLNDTADT